MSSRAIASLILVVLTVTLGGCGGGGKTTGEQAFLASHRVDALLGDCSASFRQTSERLLPEMVAVALNSASQRRVLWAGCFAGAPLRTLAWNPKVDFDDLPSSVSGSPAIAERLNEARALGLRRRLAMMVRKTPRQAPGSGQLEALELAGQTPEIGRVFLFTDALIVEPEGISLSTATAVQIRQTIDRWAPRLRGLRGVQLTLIGVGYGAHNSRSVRNAEQLFRGLARRVGVASFSWTQDLPASFEDEG
jgi:hypothetical protein